MPVWTHVNLPEGLRPEIGVEKDQGRWSVKWRTRSRRIRQLGKETQEGRVSISQKVAWGQWRRRSGFSSVSNIYTHAECQRCWRPHFFIFLLSCICGFAFFLSTFCLFIYLFLLLFFCSTLEMPTWPGVRNNSGVPRDDQQPTNQPGVWVYFISQVLIFCIRSR